MCDISKNKLSLLCVLICEISMLCGGVVCGERGGVRPPSLRVICCHTVPLSKVWHTQPGTQQSNMWRPPTTIITTISLLVSLLTSHWSRANQPRLSLAQSFTVFCHKEPARPIRSPLLGYKGLLNAKYLSPTRGILLPPRWFLMA